jgi:hypothetical protein
LQIVADVELKGRNRKTSGDSTSLRLGGCSYGQRMYVSSRETEEEIL